MIEFFIPMEPPTTTAQMHKVTVRNGKPVFYDPPQVVAMKDSLECRIAAYAPPCELSGAIRLSVGWHYQATGKHKQGEYRTTKPDTDNLEKALKDVMTKLRFWKDDAQVAEEHVEKRWMEVPGLLVRIEEV